MKSFPESVKFRGNWRNYQQRVLDELRSHLDDNNLNIVAAPGSGKTVLGLEVVRRLNKPALIISPSIAIRDQWEERYISGFCAGFKEPQKMISKDIYKPSLITVITYQAMYYAFSGRADEDGDAEEETYGKKRTVGKQRAKGRDTAVAALKKAGVGVIVADEAHHLKNEWWKCLSDLKASLENPVMVSLTATPPYDVPQNEWNRYSDICGPVDAQIPAPELVKQRNLCPHQDYVYLCAPEESERLQVEEIRTRISSVLEKIEKEHILCAGLERSPFILNPGDSAETILDDPAPFAMAAAYIRLHRGKVPAGLLKVLGLSPGMLPQINNKIMGELLSAVFYGNVFKLPDGDGNMVRIKKELERAGAVDGRSVMLEKNRDIARLLTFSLSKLKGIAEITRSENEAMGDGLRMVILCDYIRKTDMPAGPGDIKEIKRLGVVPVFETLRRAGIKGVKIGILSGTLVVVPAACKNMLKEAAKELGIGSEGMKISPLKHDPDFLEITFNGSAGDKKVRLLTGIFTKGGITALAGTKSLLGEGWDAPSINTLILASFVGSYVLSNQMRGRAIRTEKDNPSKAANIWHLACVDLRSKDPGEDFDSLERRFLAFTGISYSARIITSGLRRLSIGFPPFTVEKISDSNSRTLELSRGRAGLEPMWTRALDSGSGMFRGVKAANQSLQRRYFFGNTLTAVVLNAVYYCAGYMIDTSRGFRNFMQNYYNSELIGGLYKFIMISTGFYLAAALLLALYLFLRNGPVAFNITGIAKTVIEAFFKCNIVKTPARDFKLELKKTMRGEIEIIVKGGTEYERSLITDAIKEVLEPIDNPRYLIIRKSFFWLFNRKDYHAVPSMVSVNREYAENFRKRWTYRVGGSKLVFTRSQEGRKMLLKARAESMANALIRPPERVEVWR